MGNEGSTFVKIRRGSKENHEKIILQFDDANKEMPIYRKKSKRSTSHCRYSVDQTRHNSPPTVADDPASRRGSASTLGSELASQCSSESFLSPSVPSERRRSRSLCGAQIQADSGQILTQRSMESDSRTANNSTSNGRKSSSGLVPTLNRMRIQNCYKAAKPTIGDQILKRASASRPEIRAFLSRLNEQQLEYLGSEMYNLITVAVDNMDKPEKVLQQASRVGETYASLCPLGFRPDYFAPIADAGIAECVKLDGGIHKRCDTLLAWSQLIGALFTSVRDGYYQRVRFQRRSSLPQSTVTKQLSVDFSRQKFERQESIDQ